MATIREFFDTDFSYGVRVHATLADSTEPEVDVAVVYDFEALNAFALCYVSGHGHDLQFFVDLVERFTPGSAPLKLGKGVTLPSTRHVHYDISVENKPGPLSLAVRFYGDPAWVPVSEVASSGRLIIYAESDLTDEEVLALRERAQKARGLKVLFRSSDYVARRVKFETPLAFISHNSRDKADVARKIAIGLQRLMCPVWYDEFSLNVGDSLRESIETGLKSCRKCVLVLSSEFPLQRRMDQEGIQLNSLREIYYRRNT